MGGYRFDYEEKVWGGEVLRLNPVHFRASRLLYALQALRNIKGRLLDVGCGVGDFPEAIKHYCPHLEVHGIDISKKAISLAEKRVKKVRFRIADVQKLPFKDKSFDAVTCFDLLEHVESPKRALAEIHRVLKPKGLFHTFIPTEANYLSLGGVLIKLGWKAKEIYGGHPHHFSKEQVLNWVKEANFEIKKVRWGEHSVKQIIEIVYFTCLSIRGKNVEGSVEGLLARAKPILFVRILKILKSFFATLSFIETMILFWFPGWGVHLTCQKE